MDKCPECGEEFKCHYGTMETLVGYCSPPGHDHDDNCRGRTYECPSGHKTSLSKRNSCPACDWQGKTSCFCHDGDKIEEWPEAPYRDPRTIE